MAIHFRFLTREIQLAEYFTGFPFPFSFLDVGNMSLWGTVIRSFYCCKTIKKILNYKIHEK
jgi:hypothetical protein